jgi:hypothetical protein
MDLIAAIFFEGNCVGQLSMPTRRVGTESYSLSARDNITGGSCNSRVSERETASALQNLRQDLMKAEWVTAVFWCGTKES